MPQKNNMSSLSSTSANKSSMIHESPKDHSINIENAAPYYQGKNTEMLAISSISVSDFIFKLCTYSFVLTCRQQQQQQQHL